jgi:hypothetical protein
MELTEIAYGKIRDRLVLIANVDASGEMVIADHEAIIRMANWLGFDTKVAELNLNKILKANNLRPRQIPTVTEHRHICRSLDTGLGVDKHLKSFEEDYTFLQSAFLE